MAGKNDLKIEKKGTPFFDSNQIRILNEDFLATKAVEDESVDLTVTSPPYGIDVKYGNYDDNVAYSEYLVFNEKWLKKCFQLSRADGRLCLNIPLDKNKGGQQSVYADLVKISKEVGWKYHTTIIWNEQNISRRTAWGSWLSASAPFVISPVEVILVMYKSTWKKTSGTRRSDISRDDFMNWTNGFWNFEGQNEREPETNPVWSFNGESKKKIGHPAPFPVELPKRCIKMFSFVSDTVLDPFLGSGSTLIAAHQTNRQGIGVEVDEKYCDLAVARLEQYGLHQKTLEQAVNTNPINS
ncbi:MAG: site-specific DNA-methyltransferase [Thaumarchaeota archaeon]|nr:site-specific DNA-methyltransferase [Nitrososphaerota archaeon]